MADAPDEIDLTATDAELVPPELVAQTLGEYVRAWLVRVRSGDAGILPVAVALVLVGAAFYLVSPGHLFLSAGNLVNLFIQSAVFIVLAMAEGFVLLLGEIDLSIGYVAAIGGVIAAVLVQPAFNWPWWLAIVAALAACAGIGLVQGLIITVLRLPSFVVTLGGYLFWFWVMIILLGQAGVVSLNSPTQSNQQALVAIVGGNIDPTLAWIGLALVVVIVVLAMWVPDIKRRRAGLVVPPIGLTILKTFLIVAAGVLVVGICNVNRGKFLPVEGVPWVVPAVLFVLGAWTVLLERTQFGRHVYATGGNIEAARRAGVSVQTVRVWGFVLCSMTAGIAGVVYASWQGGMSTNINGGQLVLYAVAAAVIGGTSLFGGRGRMIHGLLGGLVIGAIYNGLYLLGFQIQWQLIATGLVLLAAVAVDALSRRGAASTGAPA